MLAEKDEKAAFTVVVKSHVRGSTLEEGFFFGGHRVFFEVADVQIFARREFDDLWVEQGGAFEGFGIAFKFGNRVDKALSCTHIGLFGILRSFVERTIHAHHPDHDFHVGRLEFLAQVIDQHDQIFAVGFAARFVEQIVVALKPDETGDFIPGLFVVGREEFFEVANGVVDILHEGAIHIAHVFGLGAGEWSRAGWPPILVEAGAAFGGFDEEDLLGQCLRHEIAKGIFGADFPTELGGVWSGSEAGLEFVKGGAVADHPDIVSGDERFAIGLKLFQQSGPRGVGGLAEKINRRQSGMAFHIGLPSEEKNL